MLTYGQLSATHVLQWFIEVSDDHYVLKTATKPEGYITYKEDDVRFIYNTWTRDRPTKENYREECFWSARHWLR